jgi:hypothetical protein
MRSLARAYDTYPAMITNVLHWCSTHRAPTRLLEPTIVQSCAMNPVPSHPPSPGEGGHGGGGHSAVLLVFTPTAGT